jgi:hypothetical protein
VRTEGEGEARVYRRLFGHRRRREVPLDIWQALSDKVDESDGSE